MLPHKFKMDFKSFLSPLYIKIQRSMMAIHNVQLQSTQKLVRQSLTSTSTCRNSGVKPILKMVLVSCVLFVVGWVSSQFIWPLLAPHISLKYTLGGCSVLKCHNIYVA